MPLPEGVRAGSHVTLDMIQARFCDGTDVRSKKKKKKKLFRHTGSVVPNSPSSQSLEHSKPPVERYFLVEGRLSSGFLNFRAFLFNDVLLLATPDDDEGPYFSAKSVPLWYHGLSSSDDAEVRIMDDGVSFMIRDGDGRTIFRGTPKSWPPLNVWVQLLQRCLDGSPPEPKRVTDEILALTASEPQTDDEDIDKMRKKIDGGGSEEREQYEVFGTDRSPNGGGDDEDRSPTIRHTFSHNLWNGMSVTGQSQTLRGSLDEQLPQTHDRNSPSSSMYSSPVGSRRHSAITVGELKDVGMLQASRKLQASNKTSLKLPSNVPSVMSNYMKRDQESDLVPAAGGTVAKGTALFDNSLALENPKKSIERQLAVLHQCSRRLKQPVTQHLRLLLDCEIDTLIGVELCKLAAETARMQSFMMNDHDYRSMVVRDFIGGDKRIARIHYFDTSRPLARNWFHKEDFAEYELHNLITQAQYWSARALLSLDTTMIQLTSPSEKLDSPSFVERYELTSLLLGLSMTINSATDSAPTTDNEWSGFTPKNMCGLRSVIARCLLESVVGYNKMPESSPIDTTIEKCLLGRKDLSIGGFVRGCGDVNVTNISSLYILLQCIVRNPVINTLCIDTVVEVRDLFWDADLFANWKFGHKSPSHDAILSNLKLLVAESEGDWPLWFISVIVRSVGSSQQHMSEPNIYNRLSLQHITNFDEDSDNSWTLFELSCDTLSYIMAQILIHQTSSEEEEFATHDRYSFKHALWLACDAIASSFSYESNDGSANYFTSMSNIGKRCMRCFLTRLMNLAWKGTKTVLGRSDSNGNSRLNAGSSPWSSSLNLSSDKWDGFNELLMCVECFVLLPHSSLEDTSTSVSESSLELGKEHLETYMLASDSIRSGFFRMHICRASSIEVQDKEENEIDKRNKMPSNIGIDISIHGAPNKCLDFPLVSKTIALLRSIKSAHRLPEDSVRRNTNVNHFEQSLSMFESLSDLMKSLEVHLGVSQRSRVLKYKADEGGVSLLDEQIFAAAICCEPRVRKFHIHNSSDDSVRGSGLGLIGAPTAIDISRCFASSIEFALNENKNNSVTEIKTEKWAPSTPIIPNDLDGETEKRAPAGEKVNRRRLTSVLNMNASELRNALKIRMMSHTSASSLDSIVEDFSNSNQAMSELTKHDKLEAEVLRLKNQLSSRVEIRHKIAALHKQATIMKERANELRKKAQREDEDHRALITSLAKDIHILKSQSQRSLTNLPNSSSYTKNVSSTMQSIEDELVSELCGTSALGIATAKPKSISELSQTFRFHGQSNESNAQNIYPSHRRDSLEAFHMDWQQRWNEREMEFNQRMIDSQETHRGKMTNLLMQQTEDYGKQSIHSFRENRVTISLRKKVQAASDALHQACNERVDSSAESVEQSRQIYFDSVEQLVQSHRGWERKSSLAHESSVRQLENKRDRMHSHSKDDLFDLGAMFQTKSKALLYVQDRIDRSSAFSWYPDWYISRIRGHYKNLEIDNNVHREKYDNDILNASLATWHLRFKKLSMSMRLMHEAYEEHIELNEADVDERHNSLLDEKGQQNNGELGRPMRWVSSSEDGGTPDEVVHEFSNSDLDEFQLSELNSEVKHAAALDEGLSKKFWKLLREEKRKWREISNLGANERLQHMADLNDLLLQQANRQVENAIVEGSIVHQRWLNVLEENGKRQLAAIASSSQRWQEKEESKDALEDWHATQDRIYNRSAMQISKYANTLMDIDAYNRRIVEKMRLAARKWQSDIQEQTEQAIAVVSEAIEDAHIQAVSHMLDQVEKARSNLQLKRRQIMDKRSEIFQKNLEYNNRMKLIEQEKEQAQVHDTARRVELETLKAHILTMWNRMGTSIEDRERWLLHMEYKIRGDINFDSETVDRRRDIQSELVELYKSHIEQAKRFTSNTGEYRSDGSTIKPETEEGERYWRRRSLYGVNKIPLRKPLPNDARRHYITLRGGDVGMAPSIELASNS